MASAAFAERIRPLRRVEYDRMVEMGLFEGEKVELLKGFIVQMSPQKSRHAGAVQHLTQFFVQSSRCAPKPWAACTRGLRPTAGASL